MRERLESFADIFHDFKIGFVDPRALKNLLVEDFSHLDWSEIKEKSAVFKMVSEYQKYDYTSPFELICFLRLLYIHYGEWVGPEMVEELEEYIRKIDQGLASSLYNKFDQWIAHSR